MSSNQATQHKQAVSSFPSSPIFVALEGISTMAGKPQAQTLTERIRVNGSPADAALTAAGELRWRSSSTAADERCLLLESEVLGCAAEGPSGIRIKAFVGDDKETLCGVRSGKRTRRDFVLQMPTDESADRWIDRLADFIASLGRPKRLLLLVNPYGGKKCARKVFNDQVKPMLEDASVLYTYRETEYQLHAQEIATSLDLVEYDGIVCVSGDGILVEVVNGLLQREDWETAIKIPLGIIPAGTGNGMAKSLLDSVGDFYSVANATFSVIRGHKRPLDVATVSQGNKKFFCVLMLTWGLVADIDIESEKYRWMGKARLNFYTLLRAVYLRRYHGYVEFVPAPGYEAYGEPVKQNERRKGEILVPKQCQEDHVEVQRLGYQGSGTQLEGLEWRSIDGPFVLVWLHNVTWTGEGLNSAPEAKFSDGYLDAVIVRDCSKSIVISLLSKMTDGTYVKSPYVIYLKVKAFRLEPGHQVGNPGKGGIIDCDGEVIARGEGTYDCRQQGGKEGGNLMAYGPPIQMSGEKGLATIFSPPDDDTPRVQAQGDR